MGALCQPVGLANSGVAIRFGAEENSHIVFAGLNNWHQSQVVQTAFKPNFTSQNPQFSFDMKAIRGSCPADAGNISDGKMPWSWKVIFRPGTEAVTTEKLPTSPRETSFFARIEISATKAWSL